MADSPDNGTSSKARKAAGTQGLSAADVIQTALEQLTRLLGRQAEAVSSCRRADDGTWTVSAEVLELSRIPDTMSLLASYEVEIDENGELTGYRRTRRYERGRADRD
ncbi:gas vesicle protein GvpO [Streptomyces sp. NPDC012888]|uniref:gas vesicle protein GvpO n=1 Tax=Streptomyces sp. NPDC012888 TaxID=3364855 RepID=UPI00369964D2